MRWCLAALLLVVQPAFSQVTDTAVSRDVQIDRLIRQNILSDHFSVMPGQTQEHWTVEPYHALRRLIAETDSSACDLDDIGSSGPEQYIWFSTPSPGSSHPRYFRTSFSVSAPPAVATLYFMGPYNWDIAINGQEVSNGALGGPGLTFDRPLEVVDVSSNLQVGENTVTITASGSEVLAMKVVPAAEGIDASALVVSDGSWEGSLDGSTWSQVQSFGSVESDASRFKGNFDLNMYRWPAYRGITTFLQCAEVQPVTVSIQGPDTVLLDFGREIFGRLEVRPFTQTTVHLQLNYGESSAEADPNLSYLSSRDLVVPPEVAIAHGPLTGFRYVQVQFLDSSVEVGSLSAEWFLRPVPILHHRSFDPQLTRILQISTYTAQLAMQTEFFDGGKRDRNPFAGDLYVTARAARAVFGHATDSMVKDTLDDLLNRVCGYKAIPVYGTDINCIPGYNAWWILSLSDLYRYTRDRGYLKSQHESLVEILRVMKSELEGGLFKDTDNAFVFTDWAPGMFQYQGQNAPEAIKVTTMEYYMAFHEAAYLLREMGYNGIDAARTADQIKNAVLSAYFDPVTGTFGNRVQTNAMAIFSGIADPATYDTIFSSVLNTPPQAGTPYFYYFVLEAMEISGHRTAALQLIKDEWGGMLNAGATSVWEVWDPACATSPDVHACLVAYINSLLPFPPVSRLYVSLAHSWSAGPAAFLTGH